jgi:hypothetical protein
MLFEVFTNSLIEELSKGTPINLICAKENHLACKQLLQDLENSVKNKPIKIIKLDIKTYQNDFDGFFSIIEKNLEENQSTRNWLILERFEELFNTFENDKGFDKQFLDHLNSLKNQGSSLICVSTESYKNKLLYVEKDRVHLSCLVLIEKKLPDLNRDSLKTILKQRHLKLSTNEPDELFDFYRKNKRFDLLDFILEQLQNKQDDHLSFAERLKTWQAIFNKDHSKITEKSWFQFIDLIRHSVKVFLLTKQRLKPAQNELEKLSIWRLFWNWMMDKFKSEKK